MSRTSSSHQFDSVVQRDGRYALRCSCGWESPSFELAKLVGHAWDRHLEAKAED